MKTTLISILAACVLSSMAFQTMGVTTVPPSKVKHQKVHMNHLKKYDAHHSCKKRHERIVNNTTM